MGDAWPWIGWIVGAYLLGSIPFAYLIGRGRGIDIRQHGSRNVGASNVGRVLGRKFGALCFVCDVGKGVICTVGAGATQSLIGGQASSGSAIGSTQMLLWIVVGAAAIVGHTNSIYLGFKGGKGVATAFGAMLGIYPYLTLPVIGAVLVWLAVVGVTRFISLASMTAMASVPAWFLIALVRPGDSPAQDDGYLTRVGHSWPFLVVTLVLAFFVMWKHRTNVARLLGGTEARIGDSKPSHEHSDPPMSSS